MATAGGGGWNSMSSATASNLFSGTAPAPNSNNYNEYSQYKTQEMLNRPQGISADYTIESLIIPIAKPIGWAFNGLSAKFLPILTTADGFFLKGFNVKAPFNIPVQRFGSMNINIPDFWGLKIGTSKFVNRTFVAIKPEWNTLTQYTAGTIPKGTIMKVGIVGNQGWKYPGGSLQFILPSKNVISQTSKIIER
jgi:hypothetical protein